MDKLLIASVKPSASPWLNEIGSPYFIDWVPEQRCCLAYTTCQTGKLFLVDRNYASGVGRRISESDRALAVAVGFQCMEMERPMLVQPRPP